jgi:hydrogenase/urease accessory protein HupE
VRRLPLQIILIGICLFFSQSVQAHDIGISTVTFTEHSNNNYILAVETPASKAFLFQTPSLPENCQLAGNPNGIIGGRSKQFEFVCDTPLTAEHSIILPWARDGIMVTTTWLDGSEVQQLVKSYAGTITIHLNELKAGSGSFKQASKRYTTLGVGHILDGIDHLLFVLGLLLLVRGKWLLVKTITAFTLAHSITLGMATFGLINMPSRPVESVIALSIVLLAVEILRAERGKYGLSYRFPWIIAFGFGLIHGLGFAGALADIGLPQKEIPIALLFFNVGVEVGQLLFVLFFLLVSLVIKQLRFAWPCWSRMIPAYIIGIVSCYWLIERVGTIVFPT